MMLEMLIQRKSDRFFEIGLIASLMLFGWLIIGAALIDMMMRGAVQDAGIGMGIFSYISPIDISNLMGLPYKFSLCVTDINAWRADDFIKSFCMWFAMVLAMMMPTLFKTSQHPARFTGFIIGYLGAWLAGCVLAVIIQWALASLQVLDANMVSQSSFLSAMVLITIGLYQVSPFKRRHLMACQTKAIDQNGGHMTAWQSGINCMLCCGPLMLIMFVFGLMNVIIMAVMTIFILIERYSTLSELALKVSSIMLIICGLLYL